MQNISMSKGEGVKCFTPKKVSENIFYEKDYQGNATIHLLQPKILDRNYLSTNNRYNIFIRFITVNSTVHHLSNQRTIGPENAHLKPDLGVLSHHEMTLTLNTHTPLSTSQVVCICKVSGLRLQ